MNFSAVDSLLPIGTGQFQVLDYVVFIAMLAISMAVGIYFGFFGNNNSTEEYLLGGRRMKTIPIAISLIASQISGATILAIPAEMYGYGTQYAIMVPFMIFTVFVINYIFVPVFYKNNIYNCYEYLEMRFSRRIRNIITISFIASAYVLLPIILFIPAIALAQVTGMNVHLINTIACSVCVIYTMLGGIKAVVWTDVIQGSIMVGASLVILICGIREVGSASEVIDRAIDGGRIEFFNMDFDLTVRNTFPNMVLCGIVIWTCYLGLNQSCVQRIVALKTLKHAQNSLWIFCIGYYIIFAINCFIGVTIFARYHACDPLQLGIVDKLDKMVPYFVQDIVGKLPGMTGVFISCVFSAGLSTISANFNSLSGVIYQDYMQNIRGFKHTEQKANFWMKTIVILSGVFCVSCGVIVNQFSSILEMMMTVPTVCYGATLGVYCLGMLLPWSNEKGALWGITTSIVFTSYLAVRSKIAILTGEMSYPLLPSRIDGCDEFGINITDSSFSSLSLNATTSPPEEDDSFALHKIAFAWFSIFGFVITVSVGILVSFLTGPNDVHKTERRLISPVAHWLLPEDIQEKEAALSINTAVINKDGSEMKESTWVWESKEGNSIAK
ncbi:sodium-coupled monocarboxylate transporter 2 isoform X1 [Lutzomyia longipalpis]|uniref:Sodium/solute symporter n=2 Tax=Lutzomyia longipalpis TaxID=7200 RepID=A0A1B0CWJ8_LUTLO|nr:sodium-coupled monocarboxylate transporter 2 isoform X1 [Lutzomyia longipalpis]